MRIPPYEVYLYFIDRAFVTFWDSLPMYVPASYTRWLPAIISWCLWERQYGGIISAYRERWIVLLESEGIWGPWQWLVSGFSSRSGMGMLLVRG